MTRVVAENLGGEHEKVLHRSPRDVPPPLFGLFGKCPAKVMQGTFAVAFVKEEEEIADKLAEAQVRIDRKCMQRHFD